MPSPTKPPRSEPPIFHELSLIGGHAALDFLNTVKYRGEDDPQDKLASLSDVIEWAQVAGLLSDAEANKLTRQSKKSASATRVYHEICTFREEVRILFESTNLKGARYARAVSQVEMAISALRPIATINRDSGELTKRIVIKTADDLKARIVTAAAEVLAARTDLRIKVCGGSDCDWMFIDRTKAGRRQWCDTRSCGNIARVRRFRLRH
jgi:predicted RNA-binding Zn ribbon-like protein